MCQRTAIRSCMCKDGCSKAGSVVQNGLSEVADFIIGPDYTSECSNCEGSDCDGRCVTEDCDVHHDMPELGLSDSEDEDTVSAMYKRKRKAVRERKRVENAEMSRNKRVIENEKKQKIYKKGHL